MSPWRTSVTTQCRLGRKKALVAYLGKGVTNVGLGVAHLGMATTNLG
jgi:hypothetical protein